MPRTSVRKELWVINPGVINKIKKTSKKTSCSPSPVSAKEGSRRWDQEIFKKFKEKHEGLQDLKIKVEKMEPVETRSKPKEQDEEVYYISSDSSVDMVLTNMKKEPPQEVKPKVRRRGRPKKVPGTKSKENTKSKKSKVKSQVKTNMNTNVENKNHLSSKTGGAEPLEEKDSSNEKEEDSENEEFEKNLKHDVNFVLAKYVVDKKIAFDIDKDKKITGFKKKMIGAIRRGDILTLRKSLEGGQVHVPKHVLMPTAPEAPAPAARKDPSPVMLSNENSPDASFEWIIDEDVPQMPVISQEERERRRKSPQGKSLANAKKEIGLAKSRVKVPLKPLNIFKSIKKTSFKIPRKEGEKARKEKVPSWVVNGALWRWALGVDDNGQSSR